MGRFSPDEPQSEAKSAAEQKADEQGEKPSISGRHYTFLLRRGSPGCCGGGRDREAR
jgi:hypothetical protein